MNNLDDMLEWLGSAPVPPRLAMMDERVLTGLAAHEASRGANMARPLGVAAIVALVIGAASSGFSGAPAIAAPALTPFGSSVTLAPSTLLLADK